MSVLAAVSIYLSIYFCPTPELAFSLLFHPYLPQFALRFGQSKTCIQRTLASNDWIWKKKSCSGSQVWAHKLYAFGEWILVWAEIGDATGGFLKTYEDRPEPTKTGKLLPTQSFKVNRQIWRSFWFPPPRWPTPKILHPNEKLQNSSKLSSPIINPKTHQNSSDLETLR